MAVIVLCAVIIYNRYEDDELSVYVALLQTYQPLPEMKDVAFLSAVTDCRVSGTTYPKEQELVSALREANGPSAEPRAFERLADLANVVAWRDTKYVHDSGGYIREERFSAKRLIRLSRVGFNKTRDKAVLCLESHAGELIFFERAFGPFWRQVGEYSVWGS